MLSTKGGFSGHSRMGTPVYGPKGKRRTPRKVTSPRVELHRFTVNTAVVGNQHELDYDNQAIVDYAIATTWRMFQRGPTAQGARRIGRKNMTAKRFPSHEDVA